jgi:nucleotide-binding universal stress UspA family protein
MSNVLKVIHAKEVFIEIFHVHPLRKEARVREIKELAQEIHADEYNNKVRDIAKLVIKLEKHLTETLSVPVSVNSVVLKGDYHQQLHDHIIFQKFDLLVLNPLRKSGFSRILSGSDTYWVIDTLEVPVLILPKNLEFEANDDSRSICFVDNPGSFMKMKESSTFNFLDKEKVVYKFFGKESFSEDVEVIFSSDPLASISQMTSNKDNHNIYILHHRNHGDFLNFLDKSFTKQIIRTLENPLIIF